MATISTPVPRLDLTSLPAAKSQRPAHISRSAFLSRPPEPSSHTQDIDMDGADVDAFGATDMDALAFGSTDMDAFGPGTNSSEFDMHLVPNTSSHATPATTKRVRAANEEASSGTKRARLDSDDVSSNSINGSTPSQPEAHPTEKKTPQFTVGYVSGGKPKAADYEDVVQALLLRAMHEYESRIVGVNPYPDSAIQGRWTKICWKEACRVAAEDYSITERMSKMVRIDFLVLNDSEEEPLAL